MEMFFQKFWSEFLKWGEAFLPKLLSAVLVLVIGWWLSNILVKILHRAMQRSKADAGVISFLGSGAKVTLKLIVGIIAASQLGLDVTSVIAALGAAGLTLGLALKDSMGNIASGVQIVFTRPFHVGDYLELNGVEGTVEKIEIMYTTLRTFDNKAVVMPNSQVTVSVITNYTAMETRRLDLNYSVDYSQDLAEVKRVLHEICEQEPLALKTPVPLIVVGEHKDSSITVGVKVWCKTDDYWTLYFAMQEKVKNEFDRNGIVIPFNQLDVHMKTAG